MYDSIADGDLLDMFTNIYDLQQGVYEKNPQKAHQKNYKVMKR